MSKIKRVYVGMFIFTCLAAGVLLYIPEAVIKTIPAAAPVTVQKLTHSDAVEASGSVLKDIATGDFLVQTFVDEKDISAVKTEQAAYVKGEAFPEREYNGYVLKIAETASKIQTGNAARTMVEVTVLITDADEQLKAGYTAQVKIKTSDTAVLTVLPYEAVHQDDGGEFIYILENNAAVKRYIETGRELSQGVEVVGLTDGEVVITADRTDIDGKTVILNG